MNRTWMVLPWLVALALPLQASTYVGNGGNAGDLDLSITLAAIRDSLVELDSSSPNLCRCPEELAESEICGVLRALTAPQVQFCREMILQHKDSLVALMSSDGDLTFSWADETLKVQSNHEDGKRVVDAVAQSSRRSIILNRARFLEMPKSFRIALVTHELFHLVPFGDGYFTDQQAIPPYRDGRTLLDTLGAAIAMNAHDTGVIADFRHLDNVSRAYRPYVFQLDFKTVARSDGAAQDLLAPTNQDGAALTFEYKPHALGFRIGVERTALSSRYQGQLQVDETHSLISLGAGYHWFPVTARLSRWSETHLAAFVDTVYGSAQYRVQDHAMSLEDAGQVLGLQVTGQVSLPAVIGFWGILGCQARYLQYRYESLNINIKDLQRVLYIGGAYAI